MRAVLMPAAGPPEVLQPAEIEPPAIHHPHELKVCLHGAGVNPVDTKLRARGVFYPDGLPAVLGCDGAGEVVETGEAVTRLRKGDKIWFCDGGLGAAQGNYAEFKVVDESVARRIPQSLTPGQAAAGPLVLITAWGALFDRGRLRSGQTVLIHAGAGGVGHVAIQMAKEAGARVCTTVGSPEKAEFARALGADETILYKETDFVAAVNAWTDGQGADLTLDTVGGQTFQQSIHCTAHFGSLVTLLEPEAEADWGEARTRNLRIGFELMLTPMLRDLPAARARHGEILDRCAALIDDRRLKIHISQTLPLGQAADAHRQIEAGHTQGKIVLSL